MKPFIRGILFTGVLAIIADGLMFGQTTNPPNREETPNQLSVPANPWFEGWYRAKFGRPSPTEEARLNANLANTAYREETRKEETSKVVAAPINIWFEGWHRAKFGRPSPTEEARLKAQAK